MEQDQRKYNLSLDILVIDYETWSQGVVFPDLYLGDVPSGREDILKYSYVGITLDRSGRIILVTVYDSAKLQVEKKRRIAVKNVLGELGQLDISRFEELNQESLTNFVETILSGATNIGEVGSQELASCLNEIKDNHGMGFKVCRFRSDYVISYSQVTGTIPLRK